MQIHPLGIVHGSLIVFEEPEAQEHRRMRRDGTVRMLELELELELELGTCLYKASTDTDTDT
jgi:hypothetical protein